jgi:hypothetical protein
MVEEKRQVHKMTPKNLKVRVNCSFKEEKGKRSPYRTRAFMKAQMETSINNPEKSRVVIPISKIKHVV